MFKVSGKLQLSPCCVLDTAVDFDEGSPLPKKKVPRLAWETDL